MPNGGQEGQTKGRRRFLVKRITPTILVLLVMSIVLFQPPYILIKALFADRLDESHAISLRYTFHSVPFELTESVTNLTRERVLILNITSQTTTYHLYSKNLTSSEIRNIGVLEKNDGELLVFWSSDVEDGKQYIIDGKLVNLYKYGTTDTEPVLLVENYREISVVDEIIFANKAMLAHFLIGTVVLAVACILVCIGACVYVVVEVAEAKEKDKNRRTPTQKTS